MKVIDEDELHACGVQVLGLDSKLLDLTATESIAAALRRAAGFLCPCPQRVLVQAVVEPLRGVVGEEESFVERVESTLEALINYGDLLEQFDVAAPSERERRSALLYAAPPSFVWRDSGAALLIGISPDHVSPLPPALQERIECVGHVRYLHPGEGENLREELSQIGLAELSMSVWAKKAPKQETSKEHLRRLTGSLIPNTSDIEGLRIINPLKSVRYYRGRWEVARGQTGRFVARRPQPYGNDSWCYVELEQGRPVRILDFPTTGSKARGCDEAWRLQLAIDAERHDPQRFNVRPMGREGSQVVDFYSPLPLWAQRNWDFLGEPVVTTESLFAYRFSAAEISQEVKFMVEELWMAAI